MDDWQRLAIYSESRLENLKNRAKGEQAASGQPFSVGRFLAVSTALLLGMLIWWIL